MVVGRYLIEKNKEFFIAFNQFKLKLAIVGKINIEIRSNKIPIKVRIGSKKYWKDPKLLNKRKSITPKPLNTNQISPSPKLCLKFSLKYLKKGRNTLKSLCKTHCRETQYMATVAGKMVTTGIQSINHIIFN